MNAIKSILDNEGFEPRAYIDPLAKNSIPADEYAIIVKHWNIIRATIGHGISDITEEESEAVVDIRAKKLFGELAMELTWFYDADEVVQDVLVEMAFQLGVTGLLNFKMTLNHLEFKQYDYASAEMLDSKWAYQTPNRAKRLSNIILALKNA